MFNNVISVLLALFKAFCVPLSTDIFKPEITSSI